MDDSNSVRSVALDISLWDEPTTGIGLYTRALAGALTALGCEVVGVGARHSGAYPRGELSRTAFTLGRLPSLLPTFQAPLYHAVNNFNLPLVRTPGKKYVLTVLDLIPLLFPETVSKKFRWQFQLWLSRSLAVADQVICISERTQQDLLNAFIFPAERAHVIHLGVNHVDAVQSPAPSELARLELPERYLLYAGALEARKNVTLVLEALRVLKARGKRFPLVLAGQKWFGGNEVEDRIHSMRAQGYDIRPLGYLSESVFYEVMRRARCLVYPSRYEGFGLPPLEAMRLGTPTIVSKSGSLPEVCADGAIQIAEDDAQSLAAAIERLFESQTEWKTWQRAGQRRAAEFTWEKTGRQTLEVYRSALLL